MTEEMTQDNVQGNQENVVKNEQASPSDVGLLQEVMAKKEKIKTLEAELSKRDADSEKKDKEVRGRWQIQRINC